MNQLNKTISSNVLKKFYLEMYVLRENIFSYKTNCFIVHDKHPKTKIT